METEIFDNKLIILLIIKESKRPLNIEQISKLCSDFDDITYFDVCLYVDNLKNNGYIDVIVQDEKPFYTLTTQGGNVLDELIELIPGVNLFNVKNLLKNQLSALKQDYEINTIITPIKKEEYKVTCYIKEGTDELISISIYSGDSKNSKRIANHWKDNANTIYSKILELMTKE